MNAASSLKRRRPRANVLAYGVQWSGELLATALGNRRRALGDVPRGVATATPGGVGRDGRLARLGQRTA